jgi:hypothetical protein
VRGCSWSILTRDPALLEAPALREVATPFGGERPAPWRDAWCDLLPLIR